jgi:hypothetical protein
MDGLQHNGLDNYTHLLTGYIGSTGFLKYIAQVVEQLRQINPDLVYGKNDFVFTKLGNPLPATGSYVPWLARPRLYCKLGVKETAAAISTY